MSKIRPTQLALIFIAVILVSTALQSYRVRTTGHTFRSILSIRNEVSEQLNIDKDKSKEIAEYILVNNIDIDYITVEDEDDNSGKIVTIYDLNKSNHILYVDNMYNIKD